MGTPNTPGSNASEGEQFLNFYQGLHFKRASDLTDPHESVCTDRKMFLAFSNEMAKSVCNETQFMWMDNRLRRIGAATDDYESKDSINNFSDGISKLVKESKKKTDAPKWKSSLSSMDESFNNLLSSNGVCTNPNVDENSETTQNLIQVLRANNVSNNSNTPPSPPSALASSYKKKERVINGAEPKDRNMFSSMETSSIRTVPPTDIRNDPDYSNLDTRPCFTTFTKSSNNRNGMNIDMVESNRFTNQSNNYGGRNFQAFSKNPEPRFETNNYSGRSKNYGSSSASSMSNNIFKTASEELKIQNMNKYGNSNGPRNTESSNGGYGYGNNQKKSLGGLGGRPRSVTSKFKPPVSSEDDQDCNIMEVDRKNASARNDLLKCIDEKMIEMIENEIMDHGKQITWDDIAGLEFAKKTIQEIVVLPFLRPDLFTGLRSPPKGILLFGPPGTGKTLIGKCIASESESTFFSISASSLTSKWIGDGEKMVRALFAVARTRQPSVIFIDEIDSLLSQRSDTEHESSRRMKTEFLVQLDGATTGEDDRILIIGATNRPQELDEAARRRLVKRLYIPLPDTLARTQIITTLLATICNNLTEEEIENISKMTDGYSGADMKCVCKEASLEPIRSIDMSRIKYMAADEVRPVMFDDFVGALSRVKSSVSPKDLDQYLEWDKTFGSGGTAR